MIYIIVIGYLIIAAVEAVLFYKKKQFKEIAVNLAILITAFVISLLLVLNVPLPSIGQVIENIVFGIVGG